MPRAEAITNYISHIRRMGCTCHWAAHHQHYPPFPSPIPTIPCSTCSQHVAYFKPPCLFWLSAKAGNVVGCLQGVGLQGAGQQSNCAMKHVCKQTFDITLFTSPMAIYTYILYTYIGYNIFYMFMCIEYYDISFAVKHIAVNRAQVTVCMCVCEGV